METTRGKSQNNTVIFALLLGLLITPTTSFAQSKGGFFSGTGGSGGGGGKGWSGRAQARESKRWTLQEWLDQKQRNSLMDQWLSMNSPSPFEFYLKGAYYSYEMKKDTDAKKSYTSYLGSVGAYAQAVGISGEYENNLKEHYNDSAGLLNIRVIGNSLQTTSITLSGGQRTRQFNYTNNNVTTKETIRNTFGQVSLQAYFTKYFGIQGLYRQYAPEKQTTLGTVEGTLVEGGIFLDFSGVRVYGNWSDDIQKSKTNTNVKLKIQRTGIKTGLQIFF